MWVKGAKSGMKIWAWTERETQYYNGNTFQVIQAWRIVGLGPLQKVLPYNV